jgi:protein tyrosine/serine phosphatase
MKTFLAVVCVGWLSLAPPAAAELAIAQVSPGIYRGPEPETAADYRQLQRLGINTVLDIRKFNQREMDREARCVRAYGMNYRRCPVAFRPRRDGSAERAVRALADVRRHPVYIHCDLGRDRAGLIVALYRVRYECWSRCAAYAEMKSFGFKWRFRAMERYFWECAGGR